MITPNQAIHPLLALALTMTLFQANGDACTDDGGAGSGAACHDRVHAPGHGHRGGMVRIMRTTCEDGSVARWNAVDREAVTFKVNNWVGVTRELALAVRRGVLQWNRVQPFYAMRETADDAADITIEVFDDVFPGVVGATKVKCRNGHEGIRKAYVYLGVRGAGAVEVRNMTAHEIGHAMGLGHSDRSHDLMDAGLAEKDMHERAICPSNLNLAGLISGTHSYAIPEEEWAEVECAGRIPG